MSHGRAPLCANSTIFCLVESGRGLPFTNKPPSWLTPLWPPRMQAETQQVYKITIFMSTGNSNASQIER